MTPVTEKKSLMAFCRPEGLAREVPKGQNNQVGKLRIEDWSNTEQGLGILKTAGKYCNCNRRRDETESLFHTAQRHYLRQALDKIINLVGTIN